MLSFNILYQDLIKFPNFADISERVWKREGGVKAEGTGDEREDDFVDKFNMYSFFFP